MAPAALARQKAISAYRGLYLISGDKEPPKAQIVEMLLDGLAASLAEAKRAQADGDSAKTMELTARAARIVAGLEKALDHSIYPALTADLSSIYRYFLRRLNRVYGVQAPEVLQELMSLTAILRSAFAPKPTI
jgi:flagellar biosynthetic protein FliS